MDSDKVFTEMCKNCHGQDSIGGEVKEAEPVGVHNITEELRERRAEPAVEEQGKKGVSSWSHFLSHDAAINVCRSGRTRWIRRKIRRDPGRACPCPVLGLAQQRLAPCMAQARGLLSVY